MDASSSAAIVCILGVFVFAPFVLQAVGLFTPNWASNSTCASIGLVYSCCSGEKTCGNTGGGDELDVIVLGLQAASLTIMFLALVSTCWCLCTNFGDDHPRGFCLETGIWFYMMLPIAGVCSIIGCTIVANTFPSSELGYSFYLCLVSGCFIVLCRPRRDSSNSNKVSPQIQAQQA